MTLPIDHEHRERASKELGTSVALAAGAGSGKTTVLTERVLNLLRSGTPPHRIAAITFTEKAAGEIRGRVREAVEQAQRETPTPYLDQALRRFGELQLSTIHSFCRTLLLSEALEAGWAPDTELFDSGALGPLVRRAVRRWRPGFEQRHPDAAMLTRISATTDQLVNAAHALVQYRDLEPVTSPRGYSPTRHFEALITCRESFEAALATCVAPETCKLVGNNTGLREGLERWCSAGADSGVTRAMLSPEKGSRAGGRAADWPSGKQALLDAIQEFQSWRTRAFEELHGLVVSDMREHLVPTVDLEKANTAVAQHDDLLFRAQQLLASHPSIRARLAAHFDAILIDEVQDTDPLQAEIAMLLSREPEASGGWHAHPPLPGRLFAVGDPKQSIYRFRRADVETWARLVNVVRKDGAGLILRQNFRSVPGIVRWVNHTFQAMPGYTPQDAHRGVGTLAPVVCLPLESFDDEAEAIARHLWDLRRREALSKWSDVMVLLPAWTHGDALQRALSGFGIPASIEGGRGFFQREEIETALNCMAAIAEPADSAAMVEVLRVWFAVSLNDLAVHVDAGGALRYTVPDQPSGPVGRAMSVFSRLRRARMRLSWVHVLDQLLEHARIRELYAVLPDGPARLANLDKLFQAIRELEAAGNLPSEVLDELRKRADDDKDSIQSRDEPRHDAVRITSIFKAKGLEAPVVVLARNQRKAQSIDIAVDRDRGQVGISVSRLLKPAGWEALKETEKRAYDGERQRWMYVATTRARDQLVVPVTDGARSCLTKQWLERGLVGVDGASHDSDVHIADGVSVRVRHWTSLAPAVVHEGPFGPHTPAFADAITKDPIGDETGAAWDARRRSSIRSSVRACPRFKTATQVAHTHRVAAGSGTGLGNIAGSVIHDVLDHLDLKAPLEERHASAMRWMELLGRDHGLEADRWEPCKEALTRILRHAVFDRIAAAEEVWKEVPFAFSERGTQIHGVIDCCFPVDAERKRWVVVDWKSDLPAPGSAAHKNYERQISLYARAVLATVTPCEHVETLLVGPHPELGLPEPEDIALDAVEEELRPVLERLIARGVAAPVVGTELEGIPVELLWEDKGLVLVLDADTDSVAELEGQGLAVIAVDTDDVDWPERSEDQLRENLVE
jgi:ATP-dependent helicase/nuclease subunit A